MDYPSLHRQGLCRSAGLARMTRDVKVSDATMKRVRAVLPDQHVVELIGTIAGYNMVSRFLVATGVEKE